ncbi:uncharacterized protein LOC133887099 [Phragmites australis]|uniref:uncharacterized protein LOC133887099 n=1 Tax=Phragmites australis TaxID=29695 RepID=UPI002D7917F6|nr:uncharacterized protein LOC133887099 [Phragmites australis]
MAGSSSTAGIHGDGAEGVLICGDGVGGGRIPGGIVKPMRDHSRSSHAHPTVKIQDESHAKVMENPKVAVAKSRSSSPATAGQVKGSGSNVRDEVVEGKIQMTDDGVAIASERSPDDLKDNRVREPFDPERANRNALLLLSVLLVVAMPVVAWRSLGQPLLLVWRLSLLVCFCFSIWTRLLDVNMRARTVFFCSSFGFVLALYADAAKDPRIGMLIAYLNSHIAVGMMGYALAERRQRDGTEVSAAAVPILSDEQAERLLHLQMLGGAYHVLLTLGVAAYVAWVLCHMADYPTEQLVMHVFFPLSGLLLFWIPFVASMLLQGALMAETEHILLIIYLFFTVLLFALTSVTLGDIWAMIIAWLATLGLSGFFGYCL